MTNERQKKQFSLTITENYYCELIQHFQNIVLPLFKCISKPSVKVNCVKPATGESEHCEQSDQRPNTRISESIRPTKYLLYLQLTHTSIATNIVINACML